MATIKEVAQLAGVSVATVSRFFNNRALISPETADKIARAVASLAYLPNQQARNLRTTRTNAILVLVPSLDNSFLSHVIRGIQNAGDALGYSVLLGITQNSAEAELSYLNLVRARGADGVILISPTVGERALGEFYRQYPLVQCSEYCSAEVPHITVRNREAAKQITGLLLGSGCRKPALITGVMPIVSFRERETGFRMALAEAGIPFDPSLVVRVPLGFNAGKRAAEKLLAAGADRVFAVADILALGAMRYFLDHGVRIPEDIAVAGFDGIPLAREFRPSLTTVIQPGFEMGKHAARLVVNLIEGRQIECETVLPYRIAVRKSTQPCLRGQAKR